MSDLSPKQIKFCREYVLNGENGRQAYIKAGYSEKTADQGAAQLLRNIKVADYLEQLKIEASEFFKVDQKWLFDKYMELYTLHREDTPAVAKGSMDSVAKMLGLNEAEKVDITSQGEKINTIDMASLSEKALEEIANAPNTSDQS